MAIPGSRPAVDHRGLPNTRGPPQSRRYPYPTPYPTPAMSIPKRLIVSWINDCQCTLGRFTYIDRSRSSTSTGSAGEDVSQSHGWHLRK